jgi:hypothetical protein
LLNNLIHTDVADEELNEYVNLCQTPDVLLKEDETTGVPKALPVFTWKIGALPDVTVILAQKLTV